MMYKEYGMGKCHSFNKEKRKEFQEKWANMTDEEKLAFANKRFAKRERFSVEKLDDFCEKWTKMTTEEKEVYVAEKKEKFKQRKQHFGNHKFHSHKRRKRRDKVVVQIIS